MLSIFQHLLSTPLASRKGNTNVIDDAAKQAISDAIQPLEKLLGGAVPLPADTEVKSATPDTDVVQECTHSVWRRGILPGGRYVKSCWNCGTMKDIEFSEWQSISDR